MNTSGMELPHQSGVEVETACGGTTELNSDTLQVTFKGRPIYFCQIECKASFEDDPLNSCLSDNIW